MSKYIPEDIDFVERILRELPSNIMFKDTECRYVFCTHYWRHIKVGDDPNWTIRGKTDLEVRKDTENARMAYEQDKRILATGKGCSYITENNIDGVTEYLEITKRPVWDDNGEIIGIVGIINDVTARVKMERELESYARTDMLTGLYNRRYLNSWVMEELKSNMFPLCIISADCDELKRINDTYGHLIGDEFIRLASSMFRICVPDDTIMFRTGGDEFLIVLPKHSLEQGQQIMDKMVEASKLLSVKGEPLQVSLGLTVMTSSKDSFMAAMERADKEMYADKAARKKERKKQKRLEKQAQQEKTDQQDKKE